MPPLDEHADYQVEPILATLDRHRVEYLLVGGTATIAYGATRPTQDFDCLPRSTDENLDRLAAALKELGARLRVGGMSANRPKDHEALPELYRLAKEARDRRLREQNESGGAPRQKQPPTRGP